MRNGSTTTETIPKLQTGDRLSRDEFERRYEQMPEVKKAELIEGVVYMPSPVSAEKHGQPHARYIGWLMSYERYTPGVRVADNSTIRLDDQNEPQPDAMLRILPECGGQSGVDGIHITGSPEWLGEISASSTAYDLHEKKEAYRRNGVCEYVVWRVDDEAIDWFVLRNGIYEVLQPGHDGVIRSEVFPGLWLDVEAMIVRNLDKIFDTLEVGVNHPSHAEFVKRLAERHDSKS